MRACFPVIPNDAVKLSWIVLLPLGGHSFRQMAIAIASHGEPAVLFLT